MFNSSEITLRIIEYVSVFLALIIVLPLHEFAHAFAAVKCGDMTPKLYKRYTLNPLAHFDLFGMILFVFAGFGWAKPVPVNPSNFKNYRRDSFFVASAGVITNLLTSFFVYPLFLLSLYIPQFGYFTTVLQLTLYCIFSYGLVFFIFNLFPFYPLDGFRIIESFSKRRSGIYNFLRVYGQYILMFLIILGFIADRTGLYQLDILGIAITYLKDLLSYPIISFWGLFF